MRVREEEERIKTIWTLFHSVFFHPPLPFASVVVSDFRSKESDVTEMELIKEVLFFLGLLHIMLWGFHSKTFEQS